MVVEHQGIALAQRGAHARGMQRLYRAVHDLQQPRASRLQREQPAWLGAPQPHSDVGVWLEEGGVLSGSILLRDGQSLNLTKISFSDNITLATVWSS